LTLRICEKSETCGLTLDGTLTIASTITEIFSRNGGVFSALFYRQAAKQAGVFVDKLTSHGLGCQIVVLTVADPGKIDGGVDSHIGHRMILLIGLQVIWPERAAGPKTWRTDPL
jgi:hypothetical protein